VGAGTYAKYRIYTVDAVSRHFRLGVYGGLSLNNSREYISYKQTNFNLMLELSGQHLIGENERFLDLAPAAQFIFNSQTRLDIGYKFQLYSDF
jgi:hypothetical protein